METSSLRERKHQSVYKLVSTLPIRNGNKELKEENHWPCEASALEDCKYLTYKEWKPLLGMLRKLELLIQ